MGNKNVMFGEKVKKGVSLALTGTLMATMFTGCGKKAPLFEDTILEEAVVMYVDDEPLIVRPTRVESSSQRCMGTHYMDVITGVIYHNNKHDFKNGISQYSSSDTCIYSNGITDGVIIVDDAEIRALTNYLTEDEIKQANDGTFTDKDAIAIQQRIASQAKKLQ